MKVIITGHTSGIGKSLYSVYTNAGHEVIGHSRSTGIDIENSDSRKALIQQSSDADIFINNAFSNSGQTLLLNELINNWQGTGKKIINISSKLSYFPVGKDQFYDKYIEQKTKQNQIIQSRIFVSKPQILNVIVGLVDTQMSSIFSAKKLNPHALSELIYELSTKDQFYIQQIIVDVPGLDWQNIHRNK